MFCVGLSLYTAASVAAALASTAGVLIAARAVQDYMCRTSCTLISRGSPIGRFPEAFDPSSWSKCGARDAATSPIMSNPGQAESVV
jgi:hypothetical protein